VEHFRIVKNSKNINPVTGTFQRKGNHSAIADPPKMAIVQRNPKKWMIVGFFMVRKKSRFSRKLLRLARPKPAKTE